MTVRLATLVLPALLASQVGLAAGQVDGELRKWHKITLTFDGPEVAETDDNNPFMNYRLNVQFEHVQSGKRYLVPGYFAADGNAAETSASSGNKWRAHFAADETGEWRWTASFRKNRWVAVSFLEKAGESGGFMDGETGVLQIAASDKRRPDFRARGRLNYVNEPYLRFAEDGEYFIKAGVDSPENLLSYADFDGDFHADGHNDQLIKTWAAHVKDWQRGDPVWQNDKGKGLIGALNYLASEELNSVSFLTNNIAGDDRNVFPFIDYDTHDRYDVSRLDQWEIVFAHAQSLGIFLHFKTQEVENQGLLDGGGMGVTRQLYYRELMARFGHHLALNWNMGEENGEWYVDHLTAPQKTSQRLAMAQFFYDLDPYRHHVVIHNGVAFDDLFGNESTYTGASLQTHRPDFSWVHPAVIQLREKTADRKRPWAVSVDEPGEAEHALVPDEVDPQHDNARMNALWGALTAGAWGTEWYFGYAHAHSDLTAEDWRSRDLFWDQIRHALNFFRMLDVPFQLARSHDELTQDDQNFWVLARPGAFYVVYAKDASTAAELTLPAQDADYSIQWYDPRNGGALQAGSVTELSVSADAPSTASLGAPPRAPAKDWVILVERR